MLVKLVPLLGALAVVLPRFADAGLAIGFYNATCRQAEDLVLAEMRAIVQEDRTLAPALLRMLLHDCFVRGCDGSIMLNSRNGTAEKDAIPNYTLRGYEAVERIKAKLEAACPLNVSCADIIVMAARDAVYLSNGPRFPVETGRRDGSVSIKEDAENDLPPPNSSIVDLKTFFSVKNLDWKDLVVLTGSHTIGVAHCLSFAADRLYNYTGKGVQDPSLNKTYAAELRKECEPGDTKKFVDMDPGSQFKFDLGYYKNVYRNTGLFISDQSLLADGATQEYVARMASAASPDEYFRDYATAMINLGRIEVLTDGNGVVRSICGAYVD